MSNDSIIAELEAQMGSAVFTQQVEQHLNSMEVTVLLMARLRGIPLDVLVAVLATIVTRLLINECPDDARARYGDLVKQLIDVAIQSSNKE
jgi:hypothetical protein